MRPDQVYEIKSTQRRRGEGSIGGSSSRALTIQHSQRRHRLLIKSFSACDILYFNINIQKRGPLVLNGTTPDQFHAGFVNWSGLRPGMVGLAPKWVRLAQMGQIRGFSDKISVRGQMH